MKSEIMIFYLIAFLLVNCNGNKQIKQENMHSITKNSTEEPISQNSLDKPLQRVQGLIMVDLDLIDYNNDSIVIFKDSGQKETYCKIIDKSIVFKNRVYNYLADRTDTLSKYFNTRYFYPEYHIMVANYISESDGMYKFAIGNREAYAKSNSEYVKYVSYPDFILQNSVKVPQSMKIYSKPDETSDIITAYEDYVFSPMKIKDEWLQLNVDKDVHGNHNFRGWVKWKENEEINIELLFVF